MPGFEFFGDEERKEVNEVLETGILITNLTTQKETEIKGKYNSIKGSLYDLFMSGLIEEDKERIR